MAAYWIGYTLNTKGQDYDELYDAIKRVNGEAWPLTTSSWIVYSSHIKAQDVLDELDEYIDENDELIVAKLTGDIAYEGLDGENADHLDKYVRGW